MSETNGSGLSFPTLELGGKLYVVKFTRGGLLYRLNKNGAELNLGGPKSIAATIDLLYAALWNQFVGTEEQLADLVFTEDKMVLVGEILGDALKKVFPPTPTPAAVPADQPAAKPLEQLQ